MPEFRLTPISYLENLPKDLPETPQGDGFPLEKDSTGTDDGGRIHMEDFAQVFSIYEKYDEKYNYQSIANVLWLESGLDDVLEFVRRLVHTFAIGNAADMHMKNWALIYPDTHTPKLSPAYDLVSTIVYPNILSVPLHTQDGRGQRVQPDRNRRRDFKKFAQIANCRNARL